LVVPWAERYLISQFLSPLTNQRSDQWGGSPMKRRRFVLEVYKAIRATVGADFPTGIKAIDKAGVLEIIWYIRQLR